MLPCLHVTASGLILDVMVAPQAKTTQIMGLHGTHLRIRLAARPIDGQANKVLLQWLAEQLHLSQQQCTLVRGHAARYKQIQLTLDSAQAEAIERWLQDKLENLA